MSNIEKDAATHKITIGIGSTPHILGYGSGDYGTISPEEIDGDGGLVISSLDCVVDGSSSILRLALYNPVIMTKMYLIRTDSKKGLYLNTNTFTSATSRFFDTPDIDKTIGLYISETPPHSTGKISHSKTKRYHRRFL